MPKKTKRVRFFNAIKSGNMLTIQKILTKTPLMTLLQPIKKNKNYMRSNKFTYGESAIDLAIKYNQLDAIKFLHNAGCSITTKHLESALQLLKKYSSTQIKDLFNYLAANGADVNTLIKKAIILDNAKTIEDITQMKWDYLAAFKEDKSSENLIQFAAKNKAIHILKSLLIKRDEPENSLGRALLDNKDNCHNKLELPLLPLEQSDLLYYNDLTPKGLALMLEYYHAKKTTHNNDHKVYFALGVQNVVRALDLFIKSTEKDLTLLYAYANTSTGGMGGHRNIYRFEKYKNKIYVILMDSFTSDGSKSGYSFNDLIELIKLKLPLAISDIVLCKNTTNQQTDTINCSHFALKNISKLLVTSSLAKEIENYHVVEKGIYNGLAIKYYRLPARFMNLAQSYDRFQTYLKNNTDEDLQAIRKTKEGKTESLEEYAFHSREGYKVKTPDTRENRNYDGINDEPRYIPDNRSIDYFASKHKEYIIPTLFKKLTSCDDRNEYEQQEKLREAIKGRDASLLTLTGRFKKLVVPESEEVSEPTNKKRKYR